MMMNKEERQNHIIQLIEGSDGQPRLAGTFTGRSVAAAAWRRGTRPLFIQTPVELVIRQSSGGGKHIGSKK